MTREQTIKEIKRLRGNGIPIQYSELTDKELSKLLSIAQKYNTSNTEYNTGNQILYNKTKEALDKRGAVINIANDIVDNEIAKLIVSKAQENLDAPTVGDLENIYQTIKKTM